jgi:riboflavin biosynthesis pyrimidine reductase
MSERTPLEPLQVLFEADGLPAGSLPAELERLHGGPFALDPDCVYANFVTSLDGVVAIPGLAHSNDFVAGDGDADRFLMGVLRAHADVVLIGSGVLGASPQGTWRPERIYPPAANAYAALREQLRLAPTPEIAVLTGHGSVDPAHPLFATGAVVLTSDSGAERLAGRLPPKSTVVTLGSATTIPPRVVVDALRARGHGRILCEAGPHTFGGLLAEDLVDELFLTSSPLLTGEAGPGTRLRLVQGADLVPHEIRPRLVSVRRHGSHLFQRYALR